MTNKLESVPTVWTAADEKFFCLVSRLFDAAFLYGAGVLLASYDCADPEQTPVTTLVTPTSVLTCATTPARRR